MDAAYRNGAVETWRVRVAGHVQGVGFRDACLQQARALGIAGWVRNRRDGTVEALVQGAPRQLAEFCGWLRHGVAAARVDAVETTPEAPPPAPLAGFERLPTV